MKPSQFVLPGEHYFSLPFFRLRKQAEPRRHEPQRHPFLLARHALYHGLKALGILPGDEILVPAYICAAAVEAIAACGAVPVFFQVRRDCLPDLEDAEARISPRTRAVLAVHYFGFPQDLEQVKALAGRHKLLLLEDCAHVLQGELAGKTLGNAGDLSFFSWRKFLPGFYGAELILNSGGVPAQFGLHPQSLLFDLKVLKCLLGASVADSKARSLLQLPVDFLRSVRKVFSGSRHAQSGERQAIDTNSSNFDLRLAGSSISRVSRYMLAHSDIAAIAAQRRQNYRNLGERLERIAGVRPLYPALPEKNSPLCFPLFFHDISGAHRVLRQMGIPATAWDGVRPPAVLDIHFPDAGFLYENLVFLPVHQNLSDRDLDVMADAVGAVCRRTTSAGVAMALSKLPPPTPAGQEGPSKELQANTLREEELCPERS